MLTQQYTHKESVDGREPRRLPSSAFAPDLLYDITYISMLERPIYSPVI
jgi:hypothetical protein